LILILLCAACELHFHSCRTTLWTRKSSIHVSDERGTAVDGHQGVGGGGRLRRCRKKTATSTYDKAVDAEFLDEMGVQLAT
jgi:hypothetical protein